MKLRSKGNSVGALFRMNYVTYQALNVRDEEEEQDNPGIEKQVEVNKASRAKS